MRQQCSLFASGIFIGFVFAVLYIKFEPIICPTPTDRQSKEANNSFYQEKMQKLIFQRNQVSMLLNQKLEKLVQLECKQPRKLASDGGAYCDVALRARTHATDKPLAEYLKTFFSGKRIASFGEGLGHYKKILGPFCKTYDAFDGASFTTTITNGSVKFLDLSVPQYGLSTYDIIISMEVAEHIPQRYEQIFLDNLARYAETGIILSWAKLNQGGFAHVNNRPIEYVIKEMKKRGFEHDARISEALRNRATLFFLKNNLNYYYRSVKTST